MKKSHFLLVILVCGMLQMTALNYFRLFGVKPDLLLICAIIASLIFEPRPAFILSVFSGVFKDIFTAQSFGINTLLFGLWSFLIIRLAREITLDLPLMRMALVFTVSFLHNTATGLIFIYSGVAVAFGVFLRNVILGSLYTALALPLLLEVIKPVNFMPTESNLD